MLKGKFSDKLNLDYIGHKLWELRLAFIFCRYHMGNTANSSSPVFGFITDLASIPWWIQWYLSKVGDYNQAAVVHDWEYTINAILDFLEKKKIKLTERCYIKYPNSKKIFLIQYRKRTRKECDDILKEGMEVLDRLPQFSIPKHKRSIIYRAVRVGGGWTKNPKKLFKYMSVVSIKGLEYKKNEEGGK